MYRRIPNSVFLALLGFGLAACQVPGQPAVTDPPAATTEHQVDRGLDVLSYDLDFEIRADRVGFTGSTRVFLKATRALDEIVLDAADMRIISVSSSSEQTVVGPFQYDQQLLRVPITPTLSAGQELSLEIDYQASGIAGMHFVLPSESGVNHIPHVFTQGEAARARFWFPCNDTPSDRATHTLTARVPRTWVTVAGGEFLSHEIDENRRTVVDSWKLDQQMPPYLFSFAAGPFVRIEDSWQGRTLWFVGEPKDGEMLRASFGETAKILTFFSEYTGFEYPFSKYAQVAVRDFPFGGMENVTNTIVTRNALHPFEYQEARPSWGLVAHEAAHQWFGDILTCESWPEAWLNEGFASYFKLLYQRERDGDAVFQQAMGQTIDGYMNACRGEQLRALVKRDYRLPMDLFFDGTIYPGGAARLNLLRGMLGEGSFRAGLKLYLEQNAYSSVTSEDLRVALEQASGEDLSWFFEQWVYSPGYPELDLAWNHRGNTLQIQLSQIQSTAGGVPESFHLPLDIHWHEKGVWRNERLWVDSSDHVFEVTTGDVFDGWVEFDPHVYLPARLNIHESAGATTLRATQGRSARSRVLAIRELADYTDDDTTSVLWNLARTDAVPNVRRECIRILADRCGAKPEYLTIFRAAYEAENDSSTKLDWWKQLSRYNSDAVIHFLLQERLASFHTPTGEREIALRALAADLDVHHKLKLAKTWVNTAGEGGRLRAAAIDLLIQIGREDLEGLYADQVFQELLPLSWKGNESPVRIQVLNGLASWLPLVDQAEPGARDRSLLDSYRKALAAPSATLRRAAAGAVAGHHHFFTAELDELMRRDPDARTRRTIEAGR
ncbi:MAG: M1 family metallopeptidase [Planctomycetes bacterium]|nr:M1 family metallopeptidase [Planctomycetota bacterium]MCP4771184.1 M1 family metallopeptidase [Planctomycetota bacterium]MCP4862089.1 M1 family metallopeptidase [Planctomycetota bacterium]